MTVGWLPGWITTEGDVWLAMTHGERGSIGMDFGRVLSDDQIAQVQDAAEALLETTGFQVQDEDLRRRCAAAGAAADPAGGIVRFPRALLREVLEQAPRKYSIGGVNRQVWEIGAGRPWGLAIVTDPWIIDYETRQPRRPRLEDLRRNTLVAEGMDHVAAVSRMDFPVSDIEGPASTLRAWEQYLVHTSKHHYFPSASPESNGYWRDIVAILADGRDPAAARLFSVMVAVVSPLVLSPMNADLLRLAVEYGAPVVPTVCPMAGSTAPCTLASTLVLGHAENLAMAALTQILKPGHPFLYAFGPSVADLRSMHDLYYTMDKVLWKVASVQLAHACGLPVSAECGGAMSHRCDPQLGAEGMLFMLAATASGADVLAGFGSCYTAMGMSAEMMLIQEAWWRAAEFLGRGIDTSAPRLGVESLRRAGPGGDFLTDELTLTMMHGGEFFQDPLFDRTPAGQTGPGMFERAHARVEQLIEGGTCPLPGRIEEQLRRYFHDLCAGL
jgi:trimethylamine--corrinoid protein Co-methyltransferase